jgi:RNA polymerase sigma factor (sigma-70 family)
MNESHWVPEEPLKDLDCDHKQETPRISNSNQQSFDNDFADLLKPNHPSAASMGAFIRRLLRQFGLHKIYAEADILSEIYVRGYKLTQGGVIIVNPHAWSKSTAFNIVRELSRKHRQKERRFEELTENTWDKSEHPPIEADAKTDVAILHRALQELEPEEQRLLTLKIVDELSWVEIRNLLSLEGKTVSEATLRKQKERALKKLRRIYHSLRPLADLGS